MTSVHAIADTTPCRNHLRLVVLGQWIRAGLALTRAATTGGGLVGGVIALWRVAQAVRLAMRLSQLLAEVAAAPAARPARVEPGLAPYPMPAEPMNGPPADAGAAALRQALVELAAKISAALGGTSHHRPTCVAILITATVLDGPRPALRRTPPHGRPPDDPRARRRRWRLLKALTKTPPPIAAPATGRLALAQA
jgi:hypothetical protein